MVKKNSQISSCQKSAITGFYTETIYEDITVEVPTVGTEDRLQVQNIKLNNYPNPFNGLTVISYTLKNCGRINLKIYAMQGQEVRTLVNENQQAGKHSVVWDGTDENGGSVGLGIYFYQLKTGNDFSLSKKMMLLK